MLLTVLAVGPLVVRRRFPLAVLVLTLLGLLALVATRNTVGAATLGCTVASTPPSPIGRAGDAGRGRGDGRRRRVGLVLRPVDLSRGGPW